MIKLNLGSNNKIIGEDRINVDGLDLFNVDGICDLNKIPFIIKYKKQYKFNNFCIFNINKECKIKDNIVDEIQMVEVLEHISFRNTEKVLREMYRIIKPNCRIHIQVPDCGKMMEMYVNKQICDCVNHKEIKDGFNADKNCPICNGNALINTKRWLYSFTGAQKHKFDAHLMVFTKENLREILVKIGFKKIEFKNHIYKLKVDIYK